MLSFIENKCSGIVEQTNNIRIKEKIKITLIFKVIFNNI